MPGDTLIIGGATDTLKAEDPLLQHQLGAGPEQHPPADAFWFFMVIAAFVAIIALPFMLNWLRRRYRRRQAYKQSTTQFTQYDEWLTSYNNYYQSLPGHQRARFLDRVAHFMSAKTFTYVNMPADEKMPLLISAASIQITFGLHKYLLDFFDTIYVMQHNYHFGAYNRPFEGHVNSNGIYLSWDNFLRGYENYNDGDNVGIHEMAHALAYVNFMAGSNLGQERKFIERFSNFSAVARPIFNAMQRGQITLLNEYAATNYNEFWAVAVETFFERPLHMKLDMPDLYAALCSLLNQDPLTPEKLLEPEP